MALVRTLMTRADALSSSGVKLVGSTHSSELLIPLSHVHQNWVQPRLTHSHRPLNPDSTWVSKVGSTTLTSRVDPGYEV